MDTSKQYIDPTFEDEDELVIDWVGLIAKLWASKLFILIVSLVFAVLGAVIALQMQKQYTVTVTLAPEVQRRSTSSSLGGIASMMGISSSSLSGNTDALNITLFPEISSSTPFLCNLFDVKVTPYVSEQELQEGKRPTRPTTVFKYITKEGKEPTGIKAFIENLFGSKKKEGPVDRKINLAQLTPQQAQVVGMLSKSIKADIDNKTGITTVSVTMDDPLIATQLADTVCRRLQEYIIDYRTKKANEDLAYYTKLAKESREKMVKAQAAYAQSVDFDRSVILQSVNSEKQRLQQEATLANQLYTQMEQQKELAKAKIQELKPIFAVVEPATMPLRPSGTSRKIVVLGFAFLGFCLAGAWKLFGSGFVTNFNKSMQEKMREQKQADAIKREQEEKERLNEQLKRKE